MADPMPLQILTALRDRLDGISVGAGYNTNPQIVMGLQPVNADQLDDGPVITLYETDDEPTDDETFGQVLTVRLSIVIEGMVRFGAESTAEKLSRLWQDINRAAFQADTTLGGLALGVFRGPRNFEYPQQGGETVAVRQIVNVHYLETYGNP